MRTLSPLRYPGGKSRAISFLSETILQDIKHMCSPFFWG